MLPGGAHSRHSSVFLCCHNGHISLQQLLSPVPILQVFCSVLFCGHNSPQVRWSLGLLRPSAGPPPCRVWQGGDQPLGTESIPA